MRGGGEPLEFDWDGLVPVLVHPMKVAIVEAIRFLERPLSASEVRRMCEERLSVSYVSYHVQDLASVGALHCVRKRPVRGAEEKFYAIPPQLFRCQSE